MKSKSGLCSKCKQINDTNQSRCKACHNEYQKSYYKKHPESITKSTAKRRTDIRSLVVTAKNRPCADCGISYPWYVMDLDHARGEKRFCLSAATRHQWALNTVTKEIEKCDVVCANCHRERTYKRNQFPDGVIDNMLGFEPRDSTFES